MGLFGFGGNNPEKTLEQLLQKAAQDAAARPKFYREFLNFDLYVMGEISGDFKRGEDGLCIAGKDTQLKLQVFPINGKNQIPVFSSLQKLRQAFKQEVGHIQSNARTILESLPPDARVILNPGASFGKEFSPDEIRQLLDGTIFNIPTPETIPSGKQVLLGQPANPPDKLMNALISYFEANPFVDKAYLAQMHVPGDPTPAHCVIGFDLAPGQTMQKVMPEIGILVQETAHGQMIDFLDMKSGGSVAHYMKTETKPFFIR